MSTAGVIMAPRTSLAEKAVLMEGLCQIGLRPASMQKEKAPGKPSAFRAAIQSVAT
jgi:hypothetical protein